MKRDAAVRWRDDTGWEYRCESCATAHRQQFWPLTREFWDPSRGMQRCRACFAEAQARAARERYRSSEAYREAIKAKRREARRASREANRIVDAINLERRKARRETADPVELEHIRRLDRERQARWRARQRAVAA